MPDEPKRVPLGKSRMARMSEEELDQLAEITPEDIERATAWTARHGSARLRGLLNAEEEPPDDGAQV